MRAIFGKSYAIVELHERVHLSVIDKVVTEEYHKKFAKEQVIEA